MNTKTLKGMGAAVSLLAGIGAASPALADSLTGVQSLGAAANAIDVWTFSCPFGTVSAQARVFDIIPPLNNPALMQVVLGKDGLPTAQATDLNPFPFGEGGGPSSYAVVADGPGLYAMAFKKTAAGVEAYVGSARCVNAGGIISNPVLTKRIDCVLGAACTHPNEGEGTAKLETIGSHGEVYYNLSGSKGLVVCFHGTGGSAEGWSSSDKLTFISSLSQSGYAFVCPTSFDRTAKQWNTNNTAANVDIVNVDSLLTTLNVPTGTKLYLVGHSNGGTFTSRYSVLSSRASSVRAVQVSNAYGVPAILSTASYDRPTLFSYADCDPIVAAADVRNSIAILTGKNPAVPAVDHDIDALYSQGSYASCHEFLDVSSTSVTFFNSY